MKKVHLIAINARYTHSNLALYYLKTYVKDLPYKIIIKELSINLESNRIIKKIIDEDPIIIGLSVYIWNVELIKEIIPEIKKYTQSKIILGGPEVSYNPEEWLKFYPKIDYIVTGHGEEGFRSILTSNNKSKEKIITIPNTSFSKIPFPYTESDLKNLEHKYIYYESSRGCPFKCTYCLSSRNDQKHESKNIELIKNELKFFLNQEPPLVKFIDRTFNINKKHYREIWRYLINSCKEAKTTFHFEIHPALLEEEDFNILSKCPKNLFQFEIGIQSTFPETLKAINRNYEWSIIKPKIQKLLTLKNIHVHVDLIAGLPYEDINKFQNSFNAIYNLKANHLQVGILKVLPGTELSEKIEKYQIIHSIKAPYQVLENKWLTKNEMNRVKIIANLIETFYNSHKFNITLNNLEKLFPTPYNLFNDLSIFYLNFPNINGKKNWEVNANLILKFIEARFPSKNNFFLDCLRWDWCSSSKSYFYPKFIKPESAKKIKKQGINFFNKHMKNNIIIYEGLTFSKLELKKSIFFKPETNLFLNNYLKGFSTVLFLPDKKNKILF